VLRWVLPFVAAALALQYVLGLWTNLFGPATFTPSTSFGPYEAHFDTGVAVTLLAILLLLAAVSTRRPAYAALAIVTFGSVLAAALFGQAFVGSSPNIPAYSEGMGVAFLVAFASVLILAFLEFASAPRLKSGPSTDAPP
jgi:hypothetical protein